MKKRTRIWAILLTVLMLVGMLPLSLFSVSAAESQTAAAASGASLEESPVISAPTVTLDGLKTAVEKAGSELWWFQDFESTTDGSVTSEGKREPPIVLSDGSLGGYISSGSLGVKDFRDGMTYTSVDGNRVLSWKAGTAPESNADQFINMGIGKNGYNMVASADIRMIGNHVISGSLFMIGSRNGSSGFISRTLVYLQGDGKLYAGSTVDPACYLGQLSSDTFTSVAVSIDLPSNLYYVYINGVNATPDGVVFADDAYMAQLKKWFGDSFAVTQYKAESFRFYQITPTTFTNSSDIEKQFPGLYIDNLYAYGNQPSKDAPTATPLVVETRPNGFATVAGMTRYYDGKGTFATENFTAGGETYVVGNAGWVLGKQSEGVTWTPHAPYVNTAPPSELTLKKNITSGLGNHWGGTGTMGNDRNATNASANVRGDAALYGSSYATGGDSYFEINGFGTLTDTFVASVDLMLGDDYTSTADNVALFNLLTFDNADCKNDSANGFHRSDNGLLTVLSSGWVKGIDGNVYFRLSTTEYTRISVVVNMVAHTFDLYVNGVLVGDDISFGKAGYSWTNAMRMMQSPTKLGSFYVDNGFVYVADKPFDALTEQPTLRNGFVEEDGVRRYYENGKPKIGAFTLDGVNYTTNSGGAVGFLVMEEGMVLSAAGSVQYANVNNDQFAYQPAKGFTNWGVALSAPMDITGYDHISFDMYVPDYNGKGYGIPADFMLTIGQEERFYPATDVTVDDSGKVTACVVSSDYKTGNLGLTTYGDVSTSGAVTGKQSFRYKDANGNKKYDKGEAAYVRTWIYDTLTSVYVDGVKTTPKYWGVAMDKITAGWHTITVKISDLTKTKSFEKFSFNTTGWTMNQGRDWCSNSNTSHSQAAAQKVAYSPIRFYTTGIMDMACTDGIVNGCYFKDGVPQKGWITEGDKQYYADPQTYRLATGIQAIGGTWYSFGENYVCGGKLNGVYTVANSVAGAQVKTTAQKVFEDGKLVLNALTAVDGALYKTDAYGVATVGITDGSVHFDANGRGTLGIKYNLSLYADFNVNFYLPTDITNVSFGEDEMTKGDGTVTMGGTEYEVYTVGRAANATTTAITLTVTAATADGKTASVTYTTNIVDYTMKVLAMDTVTKVEGQMMVAVLQYAQQAFVLLSEDHQPDATLTAALNHANAQKYSVDNVPCGDGAMDSTGDLGQVFESAQLDLTAAPKFVFNVKDGFTGTVTVRYNGNTKVYDGTKQNDEKKIVIDDLRIYNFDTTFHIFDGDTEIGTYSLHAYTKAVEGLGDFPQALYNYIAAAKAYKDKSVAG